MSLWEYKVITSGRGGFARPDLMEKFLNDLGRDEWEIIQFHTQPDNFLVFTGLARRSTQRDWTLEDAAAAAAKVEAEKLRAEFEAKFKAANQPGGSGATGEERAPSFIEEKSAPDDGFRKPVDTSRDDDPEVAEDDKDDDWDKLTAAEEDELPTFFEAIKPHMRRNQRGPGMSVGVDYLAKKWDQNEDDIKGALAECGFTMPEDEDSKAEYVEYDGDLYWLNINRRGELWINTKEKPRQIFRSVKAQKIAAEEEPPREAREPRESRESREKAAQSFGGSGSSGAGAGAGEGGESGDKSAEGESPKSDVAAEGGSAEGAKPEGESDAGGGAGNGQGNGNGGGGRDQERKQGGGGRGLPEGAELLRKIRPHMRRNRRGPGGSGSSTFLARALRVKEDDLKTAFVGLGLTMPAGPNDKALYTEFGNELWWLNLDSRGGLWINGREKRQGETTASANAESAAAPSGGAQGEGGSEQPTNAEAGATGGSAATDAVPASDAPPSGAAVAEGASASAGATDATDTTAKAAAENASPAGSGNVDASERAREMAPMPAANTDSNVADVAASTSAGSAPQAGAGATAGGVLAEVRQLLKETRSGGIAGKAERLAEELGRPVEEFLATLVSAGLKVPEKAREKPVLVEHAGEVFWLNRNPRGDLWVNVKAKSADKADEEAAGDDDSDAAEGDADGEGTEGGTASEGGEGEAEKKPKRVRTRRKTE